MTAIRQPTAQSQQPREQPDLAAIDALFERFDRSDRPGAVIGVAHHGHTIYRKAFGLANVEHRVAMRPATRVSICSVTKHMSCAAVLKLADEGRLTLDEPVASLVSGLGEATGRPTLRQLMMHTGGVRCHLDAAAFNGVTPHPVGLPMRMMRRQRTVNFAPGDGMMYCNGGYVLLSMAIEQAAQREFGSHLEQALFAPLRMDATTSPRTWWPVLPDVATFYLPNEGGGWRHGIGFQQETLGDGSVISTVDDMLRWARCLRKGWGPVSLAALTARPDDADPFLDGVYRYGLTDQQWRGIRVVEHGGGAVGASCHLLIAPDEELEIFVFFNSNEPAHEVARQVAASVLGGRLAPEPPAIPIATAAHPDLLGTFIDEEQGQVIGFADLEGQLGVASYAGSAVPALVAHRPQRDELPFHVPTALGPRYFRRRGAGEPLQWLDGGRWRELRPLAVSPGPPEALLDAIGGDEFFSDEAGARLRFQLEDGQLVMQSYGEFGAWRFHPKILSDELFVFGFYAGAASWLARLHREHGAISGIEMSSTRTRGLVFERVQRPRSTTRASDVR